MRASGYGRLGDGRGFAFYTRRRQLIVEVYRPFFVGPVPQEDDVVARGARSVDGIDLSDTRSIVAMVRDTARAARPVKRVVSGLQMMAHVTGDLVRRGDGGRASRLAGTIESVAVCAV